MKYILIKYEQLYKYCLGDYGYVIFQMIFIHFIYENALCVSTN
jgi:hypothetical protein